MFWCIEYIASFVDVFMGTYFCGTFILRDEIRNVWLKIISLSFIGATIITLLNRIELFSYVTTYTGIVAFLIIQWICYRKKYMLLTGLVFAYEVFLVMIDYFAVYLASVIIDVNIYYILDEQSFMRLACILLSKSILIILVVSLNQIFSYKKVIQPTYIIIMCICSIFLFVSNMVLINLEINVLNEKTSGYTMLFLIASFILEILLFFLVLKIAENHEQQQTTLLIEMNNKMLQKHLSETEQTFELWRQSVHDYKNHIIVLKQMAEEGRIVELKEYLTQENESLGKKMFLIKTGNSSIDNIINVKYSIAEQYGIDFILNTNIPIELKINEIDVVNILGNLLDNALEASLKETNSYIDVSMCVEKKLFIINIRNKCTTIAESRIGETSKSDVLFHGIGLKSVKRTVKKYDGEMRIEKNNEEYIVSIILPN